VASRLALICPTHTFSHRSRHSGCIAIDADIAEGVCASHNPAATRPQADAADTKANNRSEVSPLLFGKRYAAILRIYFIGTPLK
jgi:hypothetical protein